MRARRQKSRALFETFWRSNSCKKISRERKKKNLCAQIVAPKVIPPRQSQLKPHKKWEHFLVKSRFTFFSNATNFIDKSGRHFLVSSAQTFWHPRLRVRIRYWKKCGVFFKIQKPSTFFGGGSNFCAPRFGHKSPRKKTNRRSSPRSVDFRHF